MKIKLKKTIFTIIIFIFISIASIFLPPTGMAIALDNQKSDLIDKVSNDYTRKFCNSIGFGLSKESSMIFAFSENKKIFEKRKGIKNIDSEVLANKIAFSVIESCGYKLNLYGDKDIEEFANYYLSLDQENS